MEYLLSAEDLRNFPSPFFFASSPLNSFISHCYSSANFILLPSLFPNTLLPVCGFFLGPSFPIFLFPPFNTSTTQQHGVLWRSWMLQLCVFSARLHGRFLAPIPPSSPLSCCLANFCLFEFTGGDASHQVNLSKKMNEERMGQGLTRCLLGSRLPQQRQSDLVCMK